MIRSWRPRSGFKPWSLEQQVDRFRHVMLDFNGVNGVGQAFVDEIFRVFAQAPPEVESLPAQDDSARRDGTRSRPRATASALSVFQ
jgi:hypothetical protein